MWSELAAVINAQRTRAGLPTLDSLPTMGLQPEDNLSEKVADPPFITVVVCTRNRPDGVIVTLRGLIAMHYRPFEIVVIDNAPSSDATKDAIY